MQFLQTWISKKGYGCKEQCFFWLLTECEIASSLQLSREMICAMKENSNIYIYILMQGFCFNP
jgi:hypothetical protein